MGWSGGEGVMEVERSMERLRKPSPTSSTVKRDQSAACRVCLSLYVLLWGDAWGAVNERNDVWKSCSGRIQWKWLCSRWHRNVLWVDYEPTPSLHLVHFSNGLFTKWALAEFIRMRSPLWLQTSFAQTKLNIVVVSLFAFKTSFTSTYTRSYLSRLPLFVIHLCFTGNKVTKREIVQLWGRNSDWLHFISIIVVPHFAEKPSHLLQINQVDHILATD